jgi:hypothetical protein
MDTKLIGAVIAQIMEDIRNGDLSAIGELLMYIPEKNLRGYLPEDNSTEPLEY